MMAKRYTPTSAVADIESALRRIIDAKSPVSVALTGCHIFSRIANRKLGELWKSRCYQHKPSSSLAYRRSVSPVQREVQFENIHPRLAKQAQGSSRGMLTDKTNDVGFRHFSVDCHTMNLELGACRGDLGVETRGGSSYQINRHWDVRIFTLQGGHVALHAVDQFLVRRSQLRSVGIGGVVVHSRWPRVKISRPREPLTNDARSDNSPIRLDQLPIRFIVKQDLRESRDHERINDSEQDRGRDSHQDGSDKILLHNALSLQARPARVITISISLIPMNGTTIPPAP